MGLWETIVGTVIGGAILGVLGWSIPRLYELITKRPDWIARREADGRVSITRARRKTAFTVEGGIRRPGFVDSDPFQLWNPTPRDVRHGESVEMTPDSGKEQYIWLSWVDGDRRHAESRLPGVDSPVLITAKRSRKRLRLSIS